VKEFRSDRHASLQLEARGQTHHHKPYTSRFQSKPEPLGFKIKLMLALVGILVFVVPFTLTHLA